MPARRRLPAAAEQGEGLALFAPLVAAFSGDPAVVMKRMFGSENVLSANGKIFAMLTRGELVVKLPKARVDELVETVGCRRWDAGKGRPMREWAIVPPAAGEWLVLAREARAFAGG